MWTASRLNNDEYRYADLISLMKKTFLFQGGSVVSAAYGFHSDRVKQRVTRWKEMAFSGHAGTERESLIWYPIPISPVKEGK